MNKILPGARYDIDGSGFCRCIWRRGTQIWIAISRKRTDPRSLCPRRASSSNENRAYTSAKRPGTGWTQRRGMAQLSRTGAVAAQTRFEQPGGRSSSSSLTAVAIMNETAGMRMSRVHRGDSALLRQHGKKSHPL